MTYLRGNKKKNMGVKISRAGWTIAFSRKKRLYKKKMVFTDFVVVTQQYHIE